MARSAAHSRIALRSQSNFASLIAIDQPSFAFPFAFFCCFVGRLPKRWQYSTPIPTANFICREPILAIKLLQRISQSKKIPSTDFNIPAVGLFAFRLLCLSLLPHFPFLLCSLLLIIRACAQLAAPTGFIELFID